MRKLISSVSRSRLARALCAAALFAILAPPASAWGEDGHSIIAEIAQRRLTPDASARVAQLLGPGVSLASVASWADDVRNDRKQTSNWHFVDIPLDRSDYDERRDCAERTGGDCVVKELQRLKAELGCAKGEEARRDALKFAVHFVADIHQPLHTVGDRRGGNELRVHGAMHGRICQGRCEISDDTSNLHALWDSGLIRHTVWDWGAYVERLESGLLKNEAFEQQARGGSPVDWALETHAMAQRVWSDRLVPADGMLDDHYYTAVLPLLDQQLALAGVHLAGFLNQAYARASCGTVKAGD
jgi:hypothetical protein